MGNGLEKERALAAGNTARLCCQGRPARNLPLPYGPARGTFTTGCWPPCGLTWRSSSTASLLYCLRVSIPGPRTQLAKPGLHAHTLVTSSNRRGRLSLSVSHGGEPATPFLGFPGGAGGKESACQCRRHKGCGFNPWVGKIPLEEGMAAHSSLLA